MRVLVTGASGFVGRWLVDHLRGVGDEVWAASGPGSAVESAAMQVDLRRASDADNVCQWAVPEAIYHLAAVAFGPDAHRDPGGALQANVVATINLASAASRLPDPPTLLIPSSAEVYGGADIRRPLREDDPMDPASTYGSTKAAQELVAFTFHHSGRLPVVVARAFNHIGPRQRRDFVVASFAHQLAEIAAGIREPWMLVGNLLAERDFTDVRDVVRAYRLLVAGGHVGQIFNVASGIAVSIESVLARLIALSGLSVRVEVDQTKVRPIDPLRIVGDNSRLQSATGWSPAYRLDETLHDVWRDAVGSATQAGSSRTAPVT